MSTVEQKIPSDKATVDKSRCPVNLLPYTVTIQQNPHWRSNGVVKFPSATTTFGLPVVSAFKETTTESNDAASEEKLDISIGSEICPVISRPIIHSQADITGMKVPWHNIDTDIVCDETIARILTENPKYVGAFRHTIYVPDFSTAHRLIDSSYPTSFARLIKWTTK